jgi:hypothetical protein
MEEGEAKLLQQVLGRIEIKDGWYKYLENTCLFSLGQINYFWSMLFRT